MPKKLACFDFDGTLFRSPLDTPENHRKYENHTGIPWLINKEKSKELSKKFGRFIGMRRGWWGQAATLEPPLVADPAPPEWFINPVVEALKASKSDPDVLTTIMTGRHAGIKHQVLRICAQGGLVKTQVLAQKDGFKKHLSIDPDVQCFFSGDDGPAPKGQKPSDTLPWKLWIVGQLLSLNEDIETVEFWEDRIEHVEHFRSLDGTIVPERSVRVIVNHIEE